MSAPASKRWRAAFVVAAAVILAMVTGVISLPFGSSVADAGGGLPPYTKRSAPGPATANVLQSVTASCDTGDQATGGGWEGVDAPSTVINDSSPFASIDDPNQTDSWTVDYTPITTADSVTALVVCRDKKPPHV